MNLHNLIEKAEKYKNLGRFDKRSAITYINDAMFEITKRQGSQLKETFYGYFGERFKTKGTMIKFHDASLVPNIDNVSIRIFNDGSINLYELKNGSWVEASNDDFPDVEEINIEYVGFYRAPSTFDETTLISFPDEYETAVIYYLRSKMLEENGQLEEASYFDNQFRKEMLSKVSFKRDVVSKPSEYSLL